MSIHTNKKTTSIKEKAYEIAKIASDHKGFNIRICDLEGHCDYASYFVLISCGSGRQAAAITDTLVSEYNVNPSKVEGKSLGEWILIDLGDIVVHIFDQATRDFYMLDRTWGHVHSHLYVDPEEKTKTFVASSV